MDLVSAAGLCDKEAFDGEGHYLGPVEAVGMGRDRVPRRVGVRSGMPGSPLRFFTLSGARFDGRRINLALDSSAPSDPSPHR
jgi:hypothetical protein